MAEPPPPQQQQQPAAAVVPRAAATTAQGNPYHVPRQEVVSLPLPPSIRQQLLSAGLRTVADLQSMGPLDLAKEANLSSADACEVLRVAATASAARLQDAWRGANARSAQEVYEAQQAAQRVLTFCPDLDRVLGGGVTAGQVTEFCGVPGVGKTQLGMQLAVDVQVPALFGGCGGGAVYIDTEGSLMVERLVDIAQAAVAHVAALAQRAGSPQAAAAAAGFTVDAILANIIVFRVHDAAEQLAVLRLLPALLERSAAPLKLLVVDSITFHFRQDFKDLASRTRSLTAMAQGLMALAEAHALAVVLMNQVTTKVLDDSASKLVPALGESWGHAASTRVILYWQGSQRCAYVYKSPCHPPATAQYEVTAEGIRGVQPLPAGDAGVVRPQQQQRGLVQAAAAAQEKRQRAEPQGLPQQLGAPGKQLRLGA